jgi:hypothetical protein
VCCGTGWRRWLEPLLAKYGDLSTAVSWSALVEDGPPTHRPRDPTRVALVDSAARVPVTEPGDSVWCQIESMFSARLSVRVKGVTRGDKDNLLHFR